MTTQHDNDEYRTAPKVRASRPLVKLIDGRWCWKRIDAEIYEPQPALEAVLLAAMTQSGELFPEE